MKSVEKLHFITAGMPLRTKGSYNEAFEVLKTLNLDGLEMEFVHGVRISDDNKKVVKEKSKDNNFLITAHAPFYINLNSPEPEKIDASVSRIIETVNVAKDVDAYSITFHAAFYMKQSAEDVYNTVYKSMENICSTLESEDNNLWIRPETTGKGTQWGTLEEIVKLSKEFKNVLPCIDFAHIHARNNGIYNTYDEFSKMLEFVGTELGQEALHNFHAHLAGTEYSVKGEKNHLILEESDMNYKDLLKIFKEFDVKVVLVCESTNIETYTKLLKEYYLSL